MLAPIDRLYPLIALAALAAATVWLERTTRSDDPRPAAQVRTHPDFIGTNIRVSSFGEDGELRYTLVAATVRHYPLDDVTEFGAPRLRYETEEGLLRASADQGESRQGGQVLHLRGSAEIYRDGVAGNPDISLRSDSLTLWPDDHKASTDDPVVLTQGRTVAHGNAMRADNIFGMFELIGDARVSLPPRSSGATQ